MSRRTLPRADNAVPPPWVVNLVNRAREIEHSEGPLDIEAEDDDEPPHTQVPTWVGLAHISVKAKYLYWLLAMHLNMKRGDRYSFPSTGALAYLMGYSRADKIAPFLAELIAIGAVRVIKVPCDNGPQERNVYKVRFNPPPGHAAGPLTLTELYDRIRPELDRMREEASAKRRDRRNAARPASSVVEEIPASSPPDWVVLADEVSADIPAGQGVSPRFGEDAPAPAADAREPDNADVFAGQSVSPETGGHVTPESGEHVRPETRAVTKRSNNKTKRAPSGRDSAPDARRASAGSSGRAPRGGSAASGKTASSTPKRKSRQQAAAERRVFEALPAELRSLPARPLPARPPRVPLGNLIAEQLTCRTPEQLIARIERRWVARRWLAKLTGAEPLEQAQTGVGLAVNLLEPSECPDPMCEDGTIIDTGGPCRACAERKADHRAVRRSPQTAPDGPQELPAAPGGPATPVIPPQALPEPAEGPRRQECTECGKPCRTNLLTDGLCPWCVKEALNSATRPGTTPVAPAGEHDDADPATALSAMLESWGVTDANAVPAP